jgi:hypothetical protein
MAGEQPRAEGYNRVASSYQRTSWAMHTLVSLLLLLTESQGYGATLGSLSLSALDACCEPTTAGGICHTRHSVLEFLGWVRAMLASAALRFGIGRARTRERRSVRSAAESAPMAIQRALAGGHSPARCPFFLSARSILPIGSGHDNLAPSGFD